MREVDGNLRIVAHAVCGKYNLIHSPESKVHGRFYGVDIKRNGRRLRKFAIDALKDEESGC